MRSEKSSSSERTNHNAPELVRDPGRRRALIKETKSLQADIEKNARERKSSWLISAVTRPVQDTGDRPALLGTILRPDAFPARTDSGEGFEEECSRYWCLVDGPVRRKRQRQTPPNSNASSRTTCHTLLPESSCLRDGLRIPVDAAKRGDRRVVQLERMIIAETSGIHDELPECPSWLYGVSMTSSADSRVRTMHITSKASQMISHSGAE
jgi:hypothetical protein